MLICAICGENLLHEFHKIACQVAFRFDGLGGDDALVATDIEIHPHLLFRYGDASVRELQIACVGVGTPCLVVGIEIAFGGTCQGQGALNALVLVQ